MRLCRLVCILGRFGHTIRNNTRWIYRQGLSKALFCESKAETLLKYNATFKNRDNLAALHSAFLQETSDRGGGGGWEHDIVAATAAATADAADAIIAKFGVAAAAAAAMDGNLADNGVAIAHTVAVPKGLARCLKAEMSHSEGGRERVCIVFVLRNEIGEEALSGTAADEEEEEQVEHILQIHSH